jgi:two-component system sensor histidine kinase DesK
MQTRHSQHTQEKREGTVGPGRTQPADEVIARSGISFHLWRLYQHTWLVCLLFPLVQVWREPISPWQVVLRGLALSGFATGYTWLMWPHPASLKTRTRLRTRFSFLLLSVIGILVLVLSLAYGPAWLWLFIGVSAIAGVLLPLRRAFVVIVLLTLLPLFLTLKMHGGMAGVDWWWLIALMLLVRGLGLDMIGAARLGSAMRELHTARRELARLAVIEERERLSRDLHDLLGQTLSVITLKSELARGLVQDEPERCTQELAEIEYVSRRMLRDVRKTVAGYRQPTLANELAGTRQLFAAAGVAYSVEQTTGDLPPALDVMLAWAIREGVTNVIRHSRAHQCLIRLTSSQGMVEAVVLNDGARQEEQQDKRINQGHGLAGLRERVATLNGMMEAGFLDVAGKKHFRLWVAFPLQNSLQTGEAAGEQEKRA